MRAAPLGTLSVVSRKPAAYDDADGEVLTALATQASIAIRNARLMEELGRSRAVIDRRAEAEQALREIAARITAIREPGDLLQHVVDEAQPPAPRGRRDHRPVRPGHAAARVGYDAGLPDEQRDRRSPELAAASARGSSGTAVAERRVIRPATTSRATSPTTTSPMPMAAEAGIGDLIVAPIIGDDGPLGAIEVFSRDSHAFDEIDEAVLGGLADQAAIAITNARLIEELEQSQAAVARRAETERSLRDITARIAALREPDVILERVVEEARRLLGTDGAHLTRMSDDGTYLVPVVVAGAMDADDAGLAPRHARSRSVAASTAWRPRRRADLDLRLHHRPAHPARAGRRRGRRPARAVRDGRRAAARPGRRGDRHARGLVRRAA